MAAKKKQEMQVTAIIAFTDALTGRSFKVGETVKGWDEDRAKHYQDRGLVVMKEKAPAKEGDQMSIDDAPDGKKPEETEGRPGPEETKPETGGSETK